MQIRIQMPVNLPNILKYSMEKYGTKYYQSTCRQILCLGLGSGSTTLLTCFPSRRSDGLGPEHEFGECGGGGADDAAGLSC